MKAVFVEQPGGPENLKYADQPKPEPGPGQALVLIDNLPKLYFDSVMRTFTAFPRLSRVFIVTSDDETLWDRDLDAAGPIIERVRLPKLTAQDVRTFIAERVHWSMGEAERVAQKRL